FLSESVLQLWRELHQPIDQAKKLPHIGGQPTPVIEPLHQAHFRFPPALWRAARGLRLKVGQHYLGHRIVAGGQLLLPACVVEQFDRWKPNPCAAPPAAVGEAPGPPIGGVVAQDGQAHDPAVVQLKATDVIANIRLPKRRSTRPWTSTCTSSHSSRPSRRQTLNSLSAS